jgi:hypothetical protein
MNIFDILFVNKYAKIKSVACIIISNVNNTVSFLLLLIEDRLNVYVSTDRI